MTVSDEGDFKPVKGRKTQKPKRMAKASGDPKGEKKDWGWPKDWKKDWGGARPWNKSDKSLPQVNGSRSNTGPPPPPTIALPAEKGKGKRAGHAHGNVWATPSPKGGLMTKAEADEFQKAIEASLAENEPHKLAEPKKEEVQKKAEFVWRCPEKESEAKHEAEELKKAIEASLIETCAVNSEGNDKTDSPSDECLAGGQNETTEPPPPPPAAPPAVSPTESTVSEIGQGPPPPPSFAPPIEASQEVEFSPKQKAERHVQTDEWKPASPPLPRMASAACQTDPEPQKDQTKEAATQCEAAKVEALNEDAGFPSALLQQADLTVWTNLFSALQALSQHLTTSTRGNVDTQAVNMNLIRQLPPLHPNSVQPSWLQQVQQQEAQAGQTHPATPPQNQQVPQMSQGGNGWSQTLGMESLSQQTAVPTEYLRHHQYQHRQNFQGGSLFTGSRPQSSAQNSRGGGFRQPAPPPHHHGYSGQSGFQFDSSAFSAMYNEAPNPLNWNRSGGI